MPRVSVRLAGNQDHRHGTAAPMAPAWLRRRARVCCSWRGMTVRIPPADSVVVPGCGTRHQARAAGAMVPRGFFWQRWSIDVARTTSMLHRCGLPGRIRACGVGPPGWVRLTGHTGRAGAGPQGTGGRGRGLSPCSDPGRRAAGSSRGREGFPGRIGASGRTGGFIVLRIWLQPGSPRSFRGTMRERSRGSGAALGWRHRRAKGAGRSARSLSARSGRNAGKARVPGA